MRLRSASGRRKGYTVRSYMSIIWMWERKNRR